MTRTTTRQLGLQQAHRKAALPKRDIDDVMAFFREARWDRLEARGRALASRHPTQVLGWKALGTALVKTGKLSEAVGAMTRVAALAAGDPVAHADLGTVLLGLQRLDEAVASYTRALALDPRDPMTHSNLGVTLTHLGRLAEARVHHEAALEIDPARAESHNNLAVMLRKSGLLRDAEAALRRALALQPLYFDAHVNLAMTLNDLTSFEESRASYQRALAIRPDDYDALLRLGTMSSRFATYDEDSLRCLRRCIELRPGLPEARTALGNVHMRRGDAAESRRMFVEAQQLRPLNTTKAVGEKAAFSAVLLDTPGAGSTPIDYLTSRAAYDQHLYCVLPDVGPHDDAIRAAGDVVVNMIADADNGADILPIALALVERLGLPTINHPRLVMDSGREAVSRRLAGVPLCHVPKTVRLPGTLLVDAETNGAAEGLTLPLVMRVAGRHGGDEFEKVDDLASIARFAASGPSRDYYLTEYADYRSADGFFRKYRFICIDGDLFPYHLAIHDHWMVHHFRTDMANQVWMRAEEEAFLARSHEVFDEAHQAAMVQMARATGLDYCGLDVALDHEGRVLLFETNAAMLVHDEKGDTFAYKNPSIARIKDAFDAMLARRAKTRTPRDAA